MFHHFVTHIEGPGLRRPVQLFWRSMLLFAWCTNAMEKKLRWLLPAILLLFNATKTAAQTDVFAQTEYQVDSLLSLIERADSEDGKLAQILALYNTQMEGYPLLMLDIYERLLFLAQNNNDIILESNAYGMAGQSYRHSGNHIIGLTYHHKAISLAEKSGNLAALGWAYNMMAHIYKDRAEYDKAIEYYTQARINAETAKVPNPKIVLWTKMNLAAVFAGSGQLDSSLYYGHEVYPYIRNRQLVNAGSASYTTMNLAIAYSKLGSAKRAVDFFRESDEFIDQWNLPRFKGLINQAYAEHYMRYNQLDSGIFYAKKAISMVQGTMFNHLVVAPSKLLMKIYEDRDADSTIKYLKIYNAANDSIYSTRANQQLQMMTFEEDQRVVKADAEKLKYKNKVRVYLLLLGLLLSGVVVFILSYNNRQKHKANALLKQQRDEIHRQREQLRESLQTIQATQAQLIQSEKMASLGELTAGVAHEIQNPLNFVNNFSEVNDELISELVKELKEGNTEEAIAIAADIKHNEQKINEHGKRAGSIVKGMLEHSRSSSGQKEPADINQLADECLRLAYHGLRAKDKTFNADISTDFDKGVGEVNVVAQDMGRVVLNLINNAFYAVNEKAKTAGDEYAPLVKVATTKEGNNTLIKVCDNGQGIPDDIRDKIFQPFFTTKPTGSGTGLGLSLSYDIVKAHDGRITVVSAPDAGSTFTIILPTNNI